MQGFKLATGHRPPATLVYSAGTMLTNLPIRPRSRNSITPEIFANSVYRPLPPGRPVHAGLDLGAALPQMIDHAGNQLTAEGFHAQPLRVRIAPIF